MNELIQIDFLALNTAPAKINGNFAEVEEIIKSDVASKMLLVTPETTKTGKDQAAEFRRNSKTLSSAWKSHKETLIADVNVADKDVKRICAVWDDGARQISDQVDKIEQETKEICLNLLRKEQLLTWVLLKVNEDFRRCVVDDLAKLGSVTPKGSLTKYAITEVENRCKQDKADQDKIAYRLIELENRCLRAEIIPTLSQAAIASFLHADDAIFFSNLDKIINAEIDRKQRAEDSLRAKLEAEKQQAINHALKQQQAEADKAVMEKAKVEAQVRYEQTRKQELEKLANEKLQNIPDKSEKPIDPSPNSLKTLDPNAVVDFKVTVLSKKEFYFSAKAGTDHKKIKAYFLENPVYGGIALSDVYDVVISLI